VVIDIGIPTCYDMCMEQKQNTDEPATEALHIRIETDKSKQIKEVVCLLRARHPGIPWSKSSTVRYLLEKGLESFYNGRDGE